MFYPVDTWLDPGISIPGAIVLFCLLVATTAKPALDGALAIFTLTGVVLIIALQRARIQ